MEQKEVKRLLLEPFPDYAIQFRVDNIIKTKDGKTLYRVVPYIDVRSIVNRLNQIVPGGWSLDVTVEPFQFPVYEAGYVVGWKAKAVLEILGVKMSGTGSSLIYETDSERVRKQLVKLDPKSAETDAIRRAAANHGIGLYLWFFRDVILLNEEEKRILDTKQFSRYSNIEAIKRALQTLKMLGRKIYEGKAIFSKED